VSLQTAKRFTSKTEEINMVVVELGWKKLVMTKEAAFQLASALEGAEIYERKWVPEGERVEKGVDHTFHVYPNDHAFGMEIISDDLYRMAKLAGKPEK
jgi:hypothetical protein